MLTTTSTTRGLLSAAALLLLATGHIASAAATAATAATTSLSLFQPWNTSDWTASDDSVRGGLSKSYLEVLSDSSDASVARFYGTLDYTALNGSGFASQRTIDGWSGVDLSPYDRMVLAVAAIDTTSDDDNGGNNNNNKTYSLNLKDTIPATVNGVEQAGISWEYDFQVGASGGSGEGGEGREYEQVEVLFADLVPTYRGSVLNDTAPLNLSGIKRVNFMIRSFFGQEEQAGDFDLRIKSVTATSGSTL